MRSKNRVSLFGVLLSGVIAVSISGCNGGAATPPVVATQLAVSVSAANVTTGMAANVSVRALDASGASVATYAGTVHFTSSDAQATLPADSKLPGGIGNFSITLKTIGSQTITVTDTATASLTGTTSAIKVVSNAATHLSISGAGNAQTRITFKFTVTALDAANNTSTAYSGTVHFTSSDAQAMLPADSAVAGGTAQFSATMETSGAQTLTATDTTSASINGSGSISVAATAPLALNLSCKNTVGGCTSATAPPNGELGNLYYHYRQCSIFGKCVQFNGFPLAGTGGIPPYSWSWAAAAGSSLPSGLNVSNSPAEISGTPTQTGTYNTVLTVADSGVPSVQTSQNFSVTITLPPPPVVNTAYSQISAILNQPSSYTFTATGNSLQEPFIWSETGALPAGLAFASGTGTLSGTPTQTGSFPISVTATDQFKQTSAAANFTIVVTAHGFLLTGSMATARRFHTATLLPNGKVLVAGGDNDTAVASAELYDPSSGTFSATGNMTVPRAEHTATLLNNGKVLIAGGESGTTGSAAVSSAELYDPATGMFAPTTGSMTAARVAHTATLLSSGKVLIAGGDVISDNASGQSLASAEIFDPNTGSFTATGSMTVPRESHTATLLSSGKVLIAGGSDGTLGYTPTWTLYASSETFDPSTGQFTAAGMMTTQRDWHTASLLASGKVLVAGGDASATQTNVTADLFDPSSGSFALAGNMTEPRYYHAASTLNDGTVLISGGSDIVSGTRAKATAEIYDPIAATFTATGSMNAARVWHTSTVLQNGKVLITGGGDNGSVPIATAEIYQ